MDCRVKPGNDGESKSSRAIRRGDLVFTVSRSLSRVACCGAMPVRGPR